MRADVTELMDADKTAENGVIVDRDMARQRGIVGHDGVVADLTVVGDVDIGHDPIVVTQAGHATVLYRAGVESAVFADRVVVANFQAGRFAGVFLVLRFTTDGVKAEDAIAFSKAGMAFNHAMVADLAIVADLDMRADQAIRTDAYIDTDAGLGVDESGRMDHRVSKK